MTGNPEVRLPTLVPLDEAVNAGLPAVHQPLTRLPFRVGRDLRRPDRRRFRWFRERRRGSAGPNDLYLPEAAPPHRISRQHFLIGFDPEAQCFFLEDCSSSCGTHVGELKIGGDRVGGRRVLQHGDVIRPGGEHSPFVFRFLMPAGTSGPNGKGRPLPLAEAQRDRP